MVGQGVLRECLLAGDVDGVLVVGRRPLGELPASLAGPAGAKLQEVVIGDLAAPAAYAAVAERLRGYDACFFCLGVSSAGMAEADYRRVTYDITLAAAETLVKLDPGMTFVYVSGVGTDSTESGKVMWARVKGATENALLRLPFKAAYMLRPGFIRAMHGARSRTLAYRVLYTLFRPLVPLVTAAFPRQTTTTEVIGRAMLNLARHGDAMKVFEPPDINRLGRLTAS
jgi:uncharacterized protein YbjT (DUF2867 family)